MGRPRPGHPGRRDAYRAPGQPNLYPADALPNPPNERHSLGLRHSAVVEATRGSFDDVVDAVIRATGQREGRRQVEALAARAAVDVDVDVDSFYATRKPPPDASDVILVISCDGKGVVMRPDALRKATAAAAAVAVVRAVTPERFNSTIPPKILQLPDASWINPPLLPAEPTA